MCSDPNCNFVDAPALHQAEIKMDPNLIAQNEKELDAANKTVIPDDGDEVCTIPLEFLSSSHRFVVLCCVVPSAHRLL